MFSHISIFSILLWGFALYGLWFVFTVIRAKRAVAWLRQANRDRKKMELAEISPEDLPPYVQRKFRRNREALQSLGFEPLVAYTSLTLLRGVGENYFLAFLDPENKCVVSLSFSVSPRRVLLFFPVPFSRITGTLELSQVIEAEFEDETILNTHNMSLPVGDDFPEQLVVHGLNPRTEITELVEEHRKKASHLESDQNTRLRRIRNKDEYFEYYRRIKALVGEKTITDVDALLDDAYGEDGPLRAIIDPDEG